MNVHEFEGKNEEEAITKAIEALGLDREEIDVEIVEAKKSAFLFGGGKVRIRVHLDEERDGSWGGDSQGQGNAEDSWQAELEQDGYPDKQPEDYRHPDAWDHPAGRGQRGQRGRRDPGGRSSAGRSRRGSSRPDSRRSSAGRPDRYSPNSVDLERRDRGDAKPRPMVALEPESDFERKILEFLSGLLEHVGITAQVRIAFREDKKLGLDVDSPDSGILIGKRGQTLEAIQTVANVVASRLKNGSQRVIVDSQNYRERRERSLVRMAQQTADEVRRTRQSRLLEAMNPFERRLIHTTLSEESDIETASEGEGLYKRVRVLYRGPKKS
ncbi:MAG: KH domain-containing protein [Spirochaetales bacterium]|nr:KH domain-containing protein [Spirochaetales bacterium]